MSGIFAIIFVAHNAIKSCSKTNDLFPLVFAPILAREVSSVLVPAAVEN